MEVYAGGQKEDRLPQAQKLIEEGKYNDAILILTEIMKTNPDQFNEAQKLVNEIRTAREQYNELYAQLITVLNPPKGEAINEDLAYKLIRDMEGLDKTPNKAAVAAFAQARDTIVFAVTNRTFESIMDECTILLGDGKYVEAIDKYLSGFILHREFFEKKDYGNIVLNQIDSDIAEIESFIERFKALLPLIDNASTALSGALVSTSLENIETAADSYKTLMISALNLKRNIVARARNLDSIRESIQKEDESDIPYLSTLRVLSKGRVKSETREGLAGSIELYWAGVLTKNAQEMELDLEDRYSKILSLYDLGNYQEGIQEASDTSKTAEILLSLQNLWGGLVAIDKNGNPSEKGWTLVEEKLPQILKTEEINDAVNKLSALGSKQLQVLDLVSKVEKVDDPGSIESNREILLGLKKDIETIRMDIEKRKENLAGIAAAGIEV
ncbi:MAG: hypothetical protein DRP59_09090, partial [Spirochaetes bacterium]